MLDRVVSTARTGSRTTLDDAVAAADAAAVTPHHMSRLVGCQSHTTDGMFHVTNNGCTQQRLIKTQIPSDGFFLDFSEIYLR